jgi:phosphohistidine phosphatase SixA
MLITLLRHATAEDRRLALADAERALTEKGEKQVKKLAAFCHANQLLPGTLFTSCLLRAQQTANQLHSRLPDCPVPQQVNWLSLDTNPQHIVAELAQLNDQGVDDVWLVGHEPDFSGVLGCLLATDSDNFIIKKASLTRIEADFILRPSAKLLWSIPCSLMAC